MLLVRQRILERLATRTFSSTARKLSSFFKEGLSRDQRYGVLLWVVDRGLVGDYFQVEVAVYKALETLGALKNHSLVDKLARIKNIL
jgi:hypothetical protein